MLGRDVVEKVLSVKSSVSDNMINNINLWSEMYEGRAGHIASCVIVVAHTPEHHRPPGDTIERLDGSIQLYHLRRLVIIGQSASSAAQAYLCLCDIATAEAREPCCIATRQPGFLLPDERIVA